MKYFVMSSNQLMIIDGQPTHQVLVNQQPIAYQKNTAAGIITIPKPQQQTFFYMDNTGGIPSELVESVDVQPIVLNHRLGSQISLVPRPMKPSMVTQQFSLMQPVQRQPTPAKVHSHLPQNTQRMAQEQHFTIPLQKPQQQFVDQVAVTLERTSSTFRPQTNHLALKKVPSTCGVPSKTNSIQNNKQESKADVVTLSDGKAIPLAGYKDLLLQQQQQRLNMLPDVRLKKSKTSNLTKPRLKAPNSQNINRNNNSKFNNKQEIPTVGIPTVATQSIAASCYTENSPTKYSRPPQTESTISNAPPPQSAQYQSNYNSQQATMLQSASPPKAQIPQPVPQQPQKPNGLNFLIKPNPNPSNSTPCPFPTCIPASQIQNIIDQHPWNENYPDSIRMFIMHSNGEQRLITFSLPNQACTVQEILDQVGVPLTPDTPIEVSEVNYNGIHYIVTVGFLLSQSGDPYEMASANQGVPETTSPVQSPVVKEPSPEPAKEVEKPKYIEGKMAVCGYCGILSDDFNKCLRCKTKFPENVKAVTANKKFENKQLPSKKGEQAAINGNKELIVSKKKVLPRNRANDNETVILTLSSDDEDDTEQSPGSFSENILQKLGASITLSPVIKKEPSISDIQKSTLNFENDGDESVEENSKGVILHCRTVRIGSYRTFAKENVFIDRSSMTLKVLHLTNKSTASLVIERSDIVKVLICFQKQLPVLFYYLKPYMGKNVRDLLGMKDNDANFFDPLSDTESQRRLTILPENIPDDVKAALQEIYRPLSNGATLMEELTLKEANDILIKTCPKELTLAHVQPSPGSLLDVKQLLVYPSEGRGRISINTEDYMCLASDQFLNDVIIDFYLKYLVNSLSPEEQKKIHVFSTFFYKRLTTKPVKASRKSQPTELDPNLSPAGKRHARVKTWTKNINLFEKDYVVVPINENCHWFLAIICFPGLDGCQTFDGNPVRIEITPRKKGKKTTIGSVTITPMKTEEPSCEDIESDKDEAEGDESELESDDSSDDTQRVTSHVNRPPIKQPCILIFDSLGGTGRSRVVATLRDYLTCEYKAKYNKEKIFTKDSIKGACPKVPQQTNFTDCGLYLLQYVEHFLMEPIKDYYIPINSLKSWFDKSIVTRKREDITILLKKLMMDYNKDITLLPDISLPTKNGILIDQFAEDEEMEEEAFDNEEFESPPVGSETEIDTSTQEEELTRAEDLARAENVTLQLLSESEEKLEQSDSNVEVFKSDISELKLTKPQTNRDTLSYLKAKRIIRNKNVEAPLCKKIKFSE